MDSRTPPTTRQLADMTRLRLAGALARPGDAAEALNLAETLRHLADVPDDPPAAAPGVVGDLQARVARLHDGATEASELLRELHRTFDGGGAAAQRHADRIALAHDALAKALASRNAG